MSVCESPLVIIPPIYIDSASSTTLQLIIEAAIATVIPAGVAPYTATSYYILAAMEIFQECQYRNIHVRKLYIS